MKRNFFIISGIVLIFILVVIFSKATSADENKIIETMKKTAKVENQTIVNTLSAPGEVKSAITENITLNTSYSFLTMCAEKEEFVKKGDNLLKYTNGTYITAPYDCVILDYSVPTAKDNCTSNNYISISSVEELYMDINIGEEEIDNVTVGQEVDIVVNYDETKSYKGTIEKINAIGTHSNGGTKFAAIAAIKNDGELKLGMSANCTITLEKNENLPCLPIEAIYIEDDKRYVNLIKDNNINEKVIVETGKSNANYVEIVSGVSLEDTVSYETTTVTTISNEEETSENALSSLFNMGGKRNNSDKGGFKK